VVNRGFSGYNSRWGLFLLDEVLGAFNARIDFVTVCFGANDAAGADSSV
jgi:lysophospholipase L1-like esterase